MRSLICLAAMVLPLTEASAQTLGDVLPRGPYDAGFRVIQTWDRGRTRIPPTDFAGRRAEGEIGVPVQLAIWYPATRNPSRTARPMTMLDLRLVGVHDAEHGRSDVSNPFAPRSPTDSLAAMEDATRIARRISGADAARVEVRRDSVVRQRLSSYRDAPRASGRFPVAVIEGDASITNTSALAEHLASHGWIVIVSASRTSASMPLEASEPRIPIEMGVRGIEQSVAAASTVEGAEANRLVVIGVNFAGLAALEYQMRYMRASAVITINGSETVDERGRYLSSSPWFDAARIRVPVLNVHWDQPGAPPPNRSYLESLTYAERRSLVVNGLDHAGLIGNPLAFATATPARRTGYAYVIRAIHATATTAVGGAANNFLAQSPATLGFPADIAKELWERRALPHVPTRAEFAELLWDKRDVATAARLYHEARSRDSTAQLFTEVDMGVYAFRYQRLGRLDEALAIHRLTIDAYPRSHRARSDIASLLVSRGDTADAVRELETALDLVLRSTTLQAAEREGQERALRARIDRLRLTVNRRQIPTPILIDSEFTLDALYSMPSRAFDT